VTEPLIQITGLHKRYGRVHALRGADLTLQPGAIGLLGPNGAGKTTLVKILLGLVRPSSGTAKILGLDAVRQARQIREVVGYAPERDAYVPNITGAAYVAYCGELAGMPPREARKRAHEVLDYVRLGEARYRDTQTYSTGMRQRIKIAQALVHDPKLVILDEPTNGLDPKGREEILKLCHELSHQHGISMLFCSHLLNDVEAVCDYLVIVGAGQIAEHGSLKELQAGASWVEAVLSGDDDAVPSTLSELTEQGWKVEPAGPAGDRVKLIPKLAGETAPLFASAAKHGAVVRRLQVGKTTLEEVFEAAVLKAQGMA
jgi:ABC-2 type transport system ATP-binding protein